MPVLFGGSFLLLALWIFCIFDVISTSEGDCRAVPKTLWFVVVVFLPLVGSVVWLIAGRPWARTTPRPAGASSQFPEYDRPGRATGVTAESDEEFLRRCRERAEQQRRAAQEQNLDDGKEA